MEHNAEKWRISTGIPTVPEKSVELTYRYQVMPGLVLQPMAQYLIDHSTDPAQDNKCWLGMRSEATVLTGRGTAIQKTKAGRLSIWWLRPPLRCLTFARLM